MTLLIYGHLDTIVSENVSQAVTMFASTVHLCQYYPVLTELNAPINVIRANLYLQKLLYQPIIFTENNNAESYKIVSLSLHKSEKLNMKQDTAS